MITSVVIGQALRVVGNRGGHGFPTGAIVYSKVIINNMRAGSHNILCSSTPDTPGVYNCYPEDLEIAWKNRKEHAEFVLKEAKELEKKAKEKRADAERLAKFDSDEEEIASLLVSAMDSNEDKEDRVKNLAKMLKGRLRTDLL